MSGAAALAAARRRRAGPQGSSQSVSQPSPVPGTSLKRPEQMTQEYQDANSPPQRINPTVMLLNHNKIIENLQLVTTDLNDKINNDMLSKSQTIKEIRTIVEEAISNLKISENNIEFFKNKYSKMETQLSELKKHIIKVQTFAMDTNLQCIELKKKLYRDTARPKTMDQSRKSDTNRLEISDETKQEHLKQVETNQKTNEILNDDQDSNEIVA
jgi:hypothetical protein